MAVMSDDQLTPASLDEVLFVWEPAQPSGRLPRRFAAPRWFGDVGVAPARVRPPLWRLAQPVSWGFLARMRRRLVWVAAATRH